MLSIHSIYAIQLYNHISFSRQPLVWNYSVSVYPHVSFRCSPSHFKIQETYLRIVTTYKSWQPPTKKLQIDVLEILYKKFLSLELLGISNSFSLIPFEIYLDELL